MGVPEGRGWLDQVKGGGAWRSTDWWLQNSVGDAKESTAITVNNLVTAVCGDRWGPDLPGDPFVSYVNV